MKRLIEAYLYSLYYMKWKIGISIKTYDFNIIGRFIIKLERKSLKIISDIYGINDWNEV